MDKIIEVEKLGKKYHVKRMFSKSYKTIKGVEGITFNIKKGISLGIAGESGCGKTTLALLMSGVIKPDKGVIKFNGEDINNFEPYRLKEFQKNIQYISQIPSESLNPKFKVGYLIKEPYLEHKMGDKEKAEVLLGEILNLLEFPLSFLGYKTSVLSAGMARRVAIARALMLAPEVIILDEFLSGIDRNMQVNILKYLVKIKEEKNISFIVISHDIEILKQICDELLILYQGEIMEVGVSKNIFSNPLHPYTRVLIDSEFYPDPDIENRRTRISEKSIDDSIVVKGCSYQLRCVFSKEICFHKNPELKRDVKKQKYRCHFPLIN